MSKNKAIRLFLLSLAVMITCFILLIQHYKNKYANLGLEQPELVTVDELAFNFDKMERSEDLLLSDTALSAPYSYILNEKQQFLNITDIDTEEIRNKNIQSVILTFKYFPVEPVEQLVFIASLSKGSESLDYQGIQVPIENIEVGKWNFFRGKIHLNLNKINEGGKYYFYLFNPGKNQILVDNLLIRYNTTQ